MSAVNFMSSGQVLYVYWSTLCIVVNFSDVNLLTLCLVVNFMSSGQVLDVYLPTLCLVVKF